MKKLLEILQQPEGRRLGENGDSPHFPLNHHLHSKSIVGYNL
jgi:hypothetical protein